MFDREDVKKILAEKLHSDHGKTEEIIPDDSYNQLIYRISWRGGLTFSVYCSPRYIRYYAERNGESLDQRGTGKLDDRTFSMMQNMICEIENGKYKTKKTMSERLAKIIQDRQLTSCMNDTKWKELFSELKKLEAIEADKVIEADKDIEADKTIEADKDIETDKTIEADKAIEIQYKTLWDEAGPTGYWYFCGDEELDYVKTSWVEWLKIRGHIEKTFRSGRLMEPKVEKTDIHDKVEDVLKKYSIPYEYDTEEDCYVIYGYQ